MDKPRPCGCKGRRSCLICEDKYKITQNFAYLEKSRNAFVYCPYCNAAWPGWDCEDYKSHPNHKGEPLDFPGIYIDLGFLNENEHDNVITGIDSLPWDLSQSGRRKQNFGPKCNFKKRKLQLGDFCGFPKFSKFIQDKFYDVTILKDFQTIEQCSLEYDPLRGASIDPHIDDCWIWGERIVTVNLLSDSVLTLTYNNKPNKYNLECVSLYNKVLDAKGMVNSVSECYKVRPMQMDVNYPIVRVPMPKFSLLVMFDSARYDWEHQILREDIRERRVCLAYREFTPLYLMGGPYCSKSKGIFDEAKKFW
ncbi:alpha-ketoglutarate-dependent dioxygenase alkB homolog 4 [Cylas formicarius]|uniref:alpha-ketoglutarate-dependent dioxygenase alkB homolog 4 n=1 Tax=Cylas formicarius TaxID=197179 RepID=UPI00295840FC|nr:alpha-ketoglutarate-dependent dioxygenase alkB homolog 4 [Cylas formicarius]